MDRQPFAPNFKGWDRGLTLHKHFLFGGFRKTAQKNGAPSPPSRVTPPPFPANQMGVLYNTHAHPLPPQASSIISHPVPCDVTQPYRFLEVPTLLYGSRRDKLLRSRLENKLEKVAIHPRPPCSARASLPRRAVSQALGQPSISRPCATCMGDKAKGKATDSYVHPFLHGTSCHL